MQKYQCVNIDESNGIYQLQGVFDKFTIPQQWKEIQGLFKTVAPKVIDLAGIESSDSALIALLVEMKRECSVISIINAPENLVQLLDLYQVKTLLF